MKKLLCFFMIGILVFCLFGCQEFIKSDTKNSDSKIKLGIIETTGYKNKSYIHFFDENLNLIYKEENDYASLSEPFDFPVYKDGDIFVIPKGVFDKRKETSVLRYNIQSDSYTEYDLGLRSMNRLAVSEKYIFGVNTINNISTIVRSNIDQQGEILSQDFNNIFISEMAVLNETLYAIFVFDSKNIYLVELSIETLEIVNQYDISQYGDPCRFIENNGKVYISNQYTDFLSGMPSTMITVFDKSNGTFSQINTNEKSPNNLVKTKNWLFVSHYDRVQAAGNKISAINLNSNECFSFIFNHSVKQIASDGKYLYILGDNCIYKYLFENNEFKEVNKKNLDVNKSDTFFYITSFVLCY